MWPRAAEAVPSPATGRSSGQAGFLLLETLVALVIAGLALSVVAGALASVWRGTRAPLDIVSAVTLARTELERDPGLRPASAAPAGFSVSRRMATATLIERPSHLAPAPAADPPTGKPGRGFVADDVMPGVTDHPEAAGVHSGQLQRITVTVRTPKGRRVDFETVRLDALPN